METLLENYQQLQDQGLKKFRLPPLSKQHLTVTTLGSGWTRDELNTYFANNSIKSGWFTFTDRNEVITTSQALALTDTLLLTGQWLDSNGSHFIKMVNDKWLVTRIQEQGAVNSGDNTACLIQQVEHKCQWPNINTLVYQKVVTSNDNQLDDLAYFTGFTLQGEHHE